MIDTHVLILDELVEQQFKKKKDPELVIKEAQKIVQQSYNVNPVVLKLNEHGEQNRKKTRRIGQKNGNCFKAACLLACLLAESHEQYDDDLHEDFEERELLTRPKRKTQSIEEDSERGVPVRKVFYRIFKSYYTQYNSKHACMYFSTESLDYSGGDDDKAAAPPGLEPGQDSNMETIYLRIYYYYYYYFTS